MAKTPSGGPVRLGRAAVRGVGAAGRRGAALGLRALEQASAASAKLPAGPRKAVALSKKAAEAVAERTAASQLSATLGPKDGEDYDVVVHFAGDAASAYQLLQWIWPLEQLGARLRVGILCRSALLAEQIAAHTTLPVRLGRWMAQVDAMLTAPSVRCVLYVNQAMANFQALHYARPAHVHLSHGESEKSSMVSNKLKGYDYVLTAGAAARERILSELTGFADERMIDVGRPQLDAPTAPSAAWAEYSDRCAADGAEGPLIFWAPTWEGDSPAMAYGTLPVSASHILEAAERAGARLIYRPHPRTGYIDPAFAAADEQTREAVEAAGGFVDVDAAIGWHFAAADACIAEMSSVAFDWLARRGPLAMIRPRDPRADVIAGGLFDRVPSFDQTEAGSAVESVIAALAANGEGAAAAEDAAQRYLGDTTPGAQVGRFIAAVERIVAERS